MEGSLAIFHKLKKI